MAVLSITGSVAGEYVARYIGAATNQVVSSKLPKHMAKVVGEAAGYCAKAVVNYAVKSAAAVASGHAGIIGTFYATKYAARYALTANIAASANKFMRLATDSLGAVLFYYTANGGYKLASHVGKIAAAQALLSEKPKDTDNKPPASQETMPAVSKTVPVAVVAEEKMAIPVDPIVVPEFTPEQIIAPIANAKVIDEVKSGGMQFAYNAHKAVGKLASTAVNAIAEQVSADATKIVAAHVLAIGTAVATQQLTKGYKPVMRVN